MEMSVLVFGLYLLFFEFVHGLHIPYPEDFLTEQTNVEFVTKERRDTASTDVYLPDRTQIRLTISGNVQEIYFKKNNRIDISNIPIFTTRNGKTQRNYLSVNKEHAFYQAPDIGGSFLVTRDRNNTARGRQVFGTFHHNATVYAIQPSVGLETECHVVSRVPVKKLVFESQPPAGVSGTTLEQNSDSGSQSDYDHGNQRSKRQVKTYDVELFSVVDYSRYQFWYDLTSGTNRHSDAVKQLMEYMAYIINGVDMRYKSITGEGFVYNILSAGVYIADTAQSSPWSGHVSSSATLDSFNAWIKQQTSLPQFDHAMGFVGYDVVSESGDSSGIAYPEKLCTVDSTSIVEDNDFNFITITTAAHELGHSLGALHDGVDNSCDGKSNFIMATVNSVVNDPDIGQNLWHFSACSVREFKIYASKLDRENNNCMLQTSGSSRIPTTLRPMADVYGADQTCVLRFGEGSYVCRSIQNYETICINMYCNQPGTSQCYSTIPAERTPCGKGKWCEQGRCVASSLAPRTNTDNCAIGDRPGLFDDTRKTCAEVIADDSGKCYGDYTGSNCCESCNTKRTGDANCEYGDHGVSFCSSMSRYGCYSNEQYCCSTCKQLRNASLPGCEYGDRFSGCNKNSCQFYSAANLAGCCETCFDPTKTVKPPTTTTTTTTSTTTTSTTTTTPTTTTTTTLTTTTTKSTSTTTPTTSSTTTSPASTKLTDVTAGNTTTQRYFTSTPITPEDKVSDMVVIAVGCSVGAIVVIILVVIVCIWLKRRNAKLAEGSGERKPSRDNAYDNIGFVSAIAEKPNHPPPRRGSRKPSEENTSSGSVIPPVSTISNGSIEHADGYMMPATLHITTSDGVQYSAPNKPKVKPLVPPNKPKKKAFAAPKPSPDFNKQRTSKPVHYKRTSGMSNSSTDTIGRSNTLNHTSDFSVNDMQLPDGYDSIGDIQKVPQNRRPTLPENHPVGLLDLSLSNSKLDDDHNKNKSDDNLNDSSKDVRCIPINTGDNSFEKRKVLPDLPPRPLPRIKSKLKRETADVSSSNIPEKSKSGNTLKQNEESFVNNGGYEEMDNLQTLADVIHSRKLPMKPVPRRHTSSTSSEHDKPALPLKKPLRPPMKPVPRRRNSSGTAGEVHLNTAFEDEQVEIQV